MLLIELGKLTMQDLNVLLAEETQYWPEGAQAYLHYHTGWGRPIRRKIGSGGWRSGKSRWLGREITLPLVQGPPLDVLADAKAWLLGKDYDLAREEFDYVLLDVRALGYPVIDQLSKPQDGQWRMVLSPVGFRFKPGLLQRRNGAVLETETSEDIGKIEAANLIAAGMTEAGGQSKSAMEALLGRLVEMAARTDGRLGMMAQSGRFRGARSYYVEDFNTGKAPNEEGIVSASLPSWENRFVFKPCDPKTCTLEDAWPPEEPTVMHGGLHNPIILGMLRTMSHDLFGEALAALPVPDRGLILAKQWDRGAHMVRMEFEEKLEQPLAVGDGGGKVIGWRLPKFAPVHIWVDPGYKGYAVLAVQMHGPFVYVIDEIYAKGWVTTEVKQEAMRRWWWPRVRTGVIDVAGTQHQGMTSPQEEWYDKGKGIYLQYQRVMREDLIERVRVFLRDPATRRPRAWFNTSCVGTAMEAEKGWRYPEGRDDTDPREDAEIEVKKDNHAWSAFGYGVVWNYGKSGDTQMETKNYGY